MKRSFSFLRLCVQKQSQEAVGEMECWSLQRNGKLIYC